MRRGLAFVLTLCLAFGLLPQTSLAAGGDAFYIGNAIHYANTDDSLSLGAPLTTAVDNITMETWVKAETLSVGAPNIRIMYNGNSGPDGYGIYLTGANKNPCILIGQIGWLIAQGAMLSVNQWYHLCAVRSGGVWHLYINGVEQALTGIDANIYTTPHTPTGGFSIGNNAAVPENFTGCFDEVRFWTVARSAEQIRDSMYAQLYGNEAGLLAYYNFESTAGFTVTPNGDNRGVSSVPNMAAGGGYDLTVSYSPGFELIGSSSNFVNSVALGTFGFSGASYSAREDAGTVLTTVNRTGGSEGSVTLNYSTSNGTALAGTHYTATNGSITFGPGETSKTISVPIMDNGTGGMDKSFSLSLTGPAGVTVSPASATVTITPRSTVDISALSGITAPATLGIPATAITGTAQYTGTVTWSPNHATFQAGTVYTATIVLSYEPGYTFNGVPENYFTVSGASATNSANSGTVTAVFPGTPFAAPAAGEGYTLDYAAETITVQSGYEVSAASNFASLIPSGSSISGYLGTTLYVRKAASGAIPASSGTSFSVAARPATPSAVFDAAAMILSNVNNAMEYSLDGGGTWTAISGSSATLAGVTADGDIRVRVKATSSAPVSLIQVIDVAPQSAPAAPAIDYAAETVATTTALEYRIGAGAWTACAADMGFADLSWTGSALTVEFRSKASGSALASDAVSITIAARPLAPTTAAFDAATSILSGVTTSMAYSLDNGATWTNCTSSSFTLAGVTEGNDIRVRLLATGSAPVSAAQLIDLSKAATQAPAIDYAAETVATTTALEYRVGGGAWTGCTADMGFSDFGWSGSALIIEFRAKALGAILPGDIASVTIAARPETPAGSFDAAAMTLSGVNGTMEYSLNGGVNWTAVSAASVTLSDGVTAVDDILVRVGATGTAPASLQQRIDILQQAVTPGTIAIDYTAETVGTTTGLEYRTGSNPWAPCSDGMAFSALGWTGSALTVEFRAIGTADTVPGNPISVTIAARPGMPAAVFSSATMTLSSITSAMEYSLDGGSTWEAITGTSATLSDVTVDGDIRVRVKATNEAPASLLQVIDIGERADAPEAPAINYILETIATTTGLEYLNSSGEWTPCTDSMALSAFGWDGSALSVYFRTKGSDTAVASGSVSVTISARPAPPAGVSAVPESYTGAGDGQLTGLDTSMEYDAGSGWTICPAGSLTGLVPGAYLVRYRATAEQFTGSAATLTVPAGGALHTITAQAGTGGSISPSGSVSVVDGMSQTFEVTPDADYKIQSVTVDGADQGAISSYTFADVTGDHSISATFRYAAESTYRYHTLTDRDTGLMISGTGIHQESELIVDDLDLHASGACAACDHIRACMLDHAYTILWGQEISLSRGFVRSLTITIPVDARYNGMLATVVHCDDGILETIPAVITDGAIQVRLHSLSPIAVFLYAPDIPADIPKTGDSGYPLGLICAISAAALCALCTLRKRPRKAAQ